MRSGPAADDAEAVRFEALRPRLRGVAYRMTGSVSDAEDICQDAWLRWSTTDRTGVADPEGFLVTVVTRLAIDRLRSAARRREAYVGPYLPEPVLAAGGPVVDDPADRAELADSLTFAFLVLLDQLDPVERAALLLHDVFGYPFAEVARAVGRSEAAVRQLTSRARRRIEAERPPAHRPDPAEADALFTGLLGAVAAGDVEAVMAHLAPDVVQLDDGGPARHAGRRPIVGPHRVARFWVNLAKRGAHLALHRVEVNGRPGLLFTDGGRPDMVMSFELDAAGRVARIFVQLNPEKLTHLEGPPA